tara:strand:- start:1060 stop:1296 length:237 start_codon:yes stop_codon:yes gene_type:complete
MAKVVQENGMFILRDDWHIEDVLIEAENMEHKLSYGQAVQVMDVIAKSFDANIGVNWIVIGEAINFVIDQESNTVGKV